MIKSNTLKLRKTLLFIVDLSYFYIASVLNSAVFCFLINLGKQNEEKNPINFLIFKGVKSRMCTFRSNMLSIKNNMGRKGLMLCVDIQHNLSGTSCNKTQANIFLVSLPNSFYISNLVIMYMHTHNMEYIVISKTKMY